jgi:predicted DNA-binding protein (UPF0251 family)
MPNRRRHRKLTNPPRMEGYKPFGIPMRKLESVILLYEEFEALRLADYENLLHAEAAQRMNISRPTFTRLYDKARKNVARAFVEGKAIVIQGGTFVADDYWYKCGECHETMVTDHPVGHCPECDSDNLTTLNEVVTDGKKGQKSMKDHKDEP